jgi:hypothetical protein
MVARMSGDTGGPWVRIVSILAIAGLVLMAVGQLLLVVGRLTLEGSYVTGGIGVIPFLAWVVLTVVLSLASGVLPDRVGWLAIASLVSMVVLAVTATVGFWTGVWVDGLVLLILFGAWMAELARAFSAGAVVVAGAGASA